MTSRCPDTFAGRFLVKPLCPVARRLFRTVFRVRIFGEENIPAEGAYIVASNHRSYLDPPVLNSVFPEPLFFLAKEELFRPPLGWLVRHMRAVPVRRGAGDVTVLELSLEILHRGCPVCVFPEGTRAAPGTFLKPKVGVGLLAIRSGLPVLPVYIDGTDRVFPRGARFPKPGHPVGVFVGKPRRYLGYEENLKSYREVALDIMDAVIALSSPRPS